MEILQRSKSNKMKRSVKDIVPVATSHKAGVKRVLLAANWI